MLVIPCECGLGVMWPLAHRVCVVVGEGIDDVVGLAVGAVALVDLQL